MIPSSLGCIVCDRVVQQMQASQIDYLNAMVSGSQSQPRMVMLKTLLGLLDTSLGWAHIQPLGWTHISQLWAGFTSATSGLDSHQPPLGSTHISHHWAGLTSATSGLDSHQPPLGWTHISHLWAGYIFWLDT